MAKSGRKYALCIGINNYPGSDMDLSGCINDVEDWGKALQPRGFQVEKLKDKDATGKGIRDAIKAILARAGASDTVVIQYSGHGSYVDDLDGDEPDGTDECICPHVVDKNGQITDDELFDLYSKRPQGSRLIAISDSCFSGTVARVARGGPADAQSRRQCSTIRFMPPSEFLSQRRIARLGVRERARRPASPPGRYAGLLLAACQDTETAADAHIDGRANGAFSAYALKALDSLSSKATYRDWFKAIRKALPSRQYNQTPNLYGTLSMKKWKVF